MRSSRWLLVAVVAVIVAPACASSRAGKICSNVPSWNAPATRCVAAAPPPAPVVVEAPPAPPPPPKAEVKGEEIELKETVEFELNSAAILPQSHGLLGEVVKIMKDHTEIKKVRIEGHTDNTGKKDHNQKLSEGRAAAVKRYLEEAGVAAARMESRGLGQDKPIGDNATEAGRTKNRRVEIHILERK